MQAFFQVTAQRKKQAANNAEVTFSPWNSVGSFHFLGSLNFSLTKPWRCMLSLHQFF